MQNKTFKIGFIGMGTVAQGVWKHLEKSFETMTARFGSKYELAKACVRDISKKGEMKYSNGSGGGTRTYDLSGMNRML